MRRSAIYKLDSKSFRELVESSNSVTEALKYFGLKNKGGNYKTIKSRLILEGYPEDFLVKKGIEQCRKTLSLIKRTSSEEIFIEDSSYSRGNTKKRIIKENMIEYKCSECQLEDKWNGSKLILQLDHINGIHNDNRIENLRFLCPNCHSQTKTFAGRSRKK